LTESDALDRCLMTEQSDIDDEQRRKEQDVFAEFETIRHKLLPYILDTVSKAMRIKSTLKLPMLTRMADFTEWGEAISRAMGYKSMSFIEALCQNRNERNLVAIEESMVGSLLIRFWLDYKLQNVEDPYFIGSPEDLYQQLVYFAQEHELDIRSRQFPKAANILVKKLNYIKPNLKAAYGIILLIERDDTNRSIVTINDKVEKKKDNPLINQRYMIQLLHNRILPIASISRPCH
jgi:hypothetical protein